MICLKVVVVVGEVTKGVQIASEVVWLEIVQVVPLETCMVVVNH